MGCRLWVILPAGVVGRLDLGGDAHSPLVHDSFASIVGFCVLVVFDKLDAFIVRLCFTKYVLICAE